MPVLSVRRHGYVAIVAAVSLACGEHTWVTLDAVNIARLPDGRVRVIATAGCEQVSRRPCTTAGDYCVAVEWTDGASPIAPRDRTCVTNTLDVKYATQTIEVVSTAPLPARATLQAVVRLETRDGVEAREKGLGMRGSPTTVAVP